MINIKLHLYKCIHIYIYIHIQVLLYIKTFKMIKLTCSLLSSLWTNKKLLLFKFSWFTCVDIDGSVIICSQHVTLSGACSALEFIKPWVEWEWLWRALWARWTWSKSGWICIVLSSLNLIRNSKFVQLVSCNGPLACLTHISNSQRSFPSTFFLSFRM